MKTKLALLLASCCAAAWAQSSNLYVFAAPGGATEGGYTDKTLHLGFGADGILWKGIGVNVEAGALAPPQYFGSEAVGTVSLNASFHLLRGPKHKFDPFLTTGYTLMFRNGTANLANFGGGTNYWFSRHVGARVEFRDHVYPSSPPVHFWGFRFGVAFRFAG